MKKDITELYLFVDDFCQSCDILLSQHFLPHFQKKRLTRTPQMPLSEILTIVLLYHQSPCKNFKFFYHSYLMLYKADFPRLLSYERFVELKPRTLPYLALLLQWFTEQAQATGIAYIDSTSLSVCHPKRMSRNKVFKGLAKIGKTTKGWFFGFKMHLVINHKGCIQGVSITATHVDDRTPVPKLTQHLKGLLFGDKGYIKKALFQDLYARGLKLVTGIKKGMKNHLIPLHEKVLLRKRPLIETVFDYLKNKFTIEHTRHRSPWNFLVHILSTLVAYSLKSNKPAIKNDPSLHF